MGLIDKLKHAVEGPHSATTPTAPPPSTSPTPQLAPSNGLSVEKVTLQKGASLSIEKTELVTAVCSWNSGTDYDVYALVLKRDGTVETVSQFGTQNHPQEFTPEVCNGAVRHLGDVGRDAGSHGDAREVIEIRLTPDILAVVPVAYSAQSNGTGSFYRYRVSLQVSNGKQTVEVTSANANNDDKVYSCVPAVIRNAPEGVQIEAVELYSARGSEKRPVVSANGSVTMDAGEVNAYK